MKTDKNLISDEDKKSFAARRRDDVVFVSRRDADLIRLSDALNGKKTIADMIQEGSLSPEEVLIIQRTLEINGYSKGNMFNLPYSFIKRILNSS